MNINEKYAINLFISVFQWTITNKISIIIQHLKINEIQKAPE